MSVSEEQMKIWAKAPSESEEAKCQNAVSRISTIVRNKFGDDVSIFLQGSYKNRTNVRLDSDVDIVVRHNKVFFPDIGKLTPADKLAHNVFYKDSDYTFSQFKSDVHELLNNEFGSQDVERKNKCIKVKKNSYRVDADVVPCFVHKRFRAFNDIEAKGIELRSDDGLKVYSFPEQHYNNGVSKNKETDLMYKSAVRILKHVRNNLVDDGIIKLNDMSSFFLECLVWNVFSEHFNKETYYAAMRAVIAKIFNDMLEIEKSNAYAEVSDLKWLFKGSNRTPEQAKIFMQHAWDYIGYEN